MLHPFLVLALLAADEPKGLESRISEVTVFSDRAQVTRKAEVDLSSGTTRVALKKLPGWLDDASVKVALQPADAGRIVDVEVDKTFLASSPEEEVKKAEAGVREIADQLASLDDENMVLDAEAKQVEAIRAFSLDKLPKDMATRDIKVATFGETVDFVADRLKKVAVAKRGIERKRRELAPELAARQKALSEVQQRAKLEERTVVVTLEGSAGRHAALTVSYVTPGATWEPVGELRTGSDLKGVTLAQYGVVSQTTGEDWEGAKVRLSTQNLDQAMKLPELEALKVGVPGEMLVAMADEKEKSWQRAFSAYSSANADRGGYWQDNIARQLEVQQRVTAEFATIQARGTTEQFLAQGARTVRADGKPVRLAIETGDLTASGRVIAAPAISLNAARTLDLTNTGAEPILPGTFALYVDGAFLGSTNLPFVAVGEKFSVYAGSADRIKLARVLDRKRSSLERGGKRTKVSVSWLVTAENLSELPSAVDLADRVPISESDEIRVSGVKVSPDIRPDGEGLIHWQLALAPKTSQTFRVEYTLEYPTELLARLDQLKNAPAVQAAPAKRAIYDEVEQVDNALK